MFLYQTLVVTSCSSFMLSCFVPLVSLVFLTVSFTEYLVCCMEFNSILCLWIEQLKVYCFYIISYWKYFAFQHLSNIKFMCLLWSAVHVVIALSIHLSVFLNIKIINHAIQVELPRTEEHHWKVCLLVSSALRWRSHFGVSQAMLTFRNLCYRNRPG